MNEVKAFMKTNLASFLICKDVITDIYTENVSLFSIINKIRTSQIPFTIEFVFFYALRGLEGTHNFSIAHQTPSGVSSNIFSDRTAVFSDPIPITQITCQMSFKFTEEGIHLFHAILDNEIIGEYAISVIKIQSDDKLEKQKTRITNSLGAD